MNDERTASYVLVVVFDDEGVFADLSRSYAQRVCSIAMIVQLTIRGLVRAHTVRGQLAWSCSSRVDDGFDVLVNDADFQRRSIDSDVVRWRGGGIGDYLEWRALDVFSVPKHVQLIGSRRQRSVCGLENVVVKLLHSDRDIGFGAKQSRGDSTLFMQVTSIDDEFIRLIQRSSM